MKLKKKKGPSPTSDIRAVYSHKKIDEGDDEVYTTRRGITTCLDYKINCSMYIPKPN